MNQINNNYKTQDNDQTLANQRAKSKLISCSKLANNSIAISHTDTIPIIFEQPLNLVHHGKGIHSDREIPLTTDTDTLAVAVWYDTDN